MDMAATVVEDVMAAVGLHPTLAVAATAPATLRAAAIIVAQAAEVVAVLPGGEDTEDAVAIAADQVQHEYS